MSRTKETVSDDLTLKPGLTIKPDVNLNEAKVLSEEIYGLRTTFVKQLPGYDDLNFKVNVENVKETKDDDSKLSTGDASNAKESTYVLKVMNTLDSIDLQFVETVNDLLLFLHAKGFRVPIPVRTLEGTYYRRIALNSGCHVVRLMVYLEGKTLVEDYRALIQEDSSNVNQLFYDVGRYVAQLNLTMKDFHRLEVYDKRESVWMLNKLPKLREFLYAIEEDVDDYVSVGNVIDEFERRILKTDVLQRLEHGLIHGDFNEQNVLIDKDEFRVSAILDFGDTNVNCYLFEIAITITYMTIICNDLDVGGYVLAGYKSVREVTDEEFNLLKICVMARLCQTLVMSAYSIKLDPSNDYILSTAKTGWNVFRSLLKVPEDVLLKRWRQIVDDFA